MAENKGPYTCTSDSRSYMLYFNGKPLGGAGTMGTATHTADGRRRHWKHIQADAKENAETAKRRCAQLNAEYESAEDKENYIPHV